MSRTPRNQLAAKEFGKRVKTLHRKAGEPSAKEIELWIYRDGGVRVSEESIRKAIKGGDEIDPLQCNAELLVGLRAYFNVPPAELGSFAARRIASLLALAGVQGPGNSDPFAGSGESSTGSDLGNSQSGWISSPGLRLVVGQ